MQQSTRRGSPSRGSRSVGGAVLLALACAVVPGVSADTGDDGEAVTGADAVNGMAASTPGDAGTAVPMLRPRWIEPRRRQDASGTDAAASRDWRDGSRIVMHALPVRSEAARGVEDLLERLGAETLERRSVEVTASTDQVRYFHADDAPMATDLAAALEPLLGSVRVRDLTFYRPLPESGALEIWLR